MALQLVGIESQLRLVIARLRRSAGPMVRSSPPRGHVHNRYTYLMALRGDTVNTKLLGMNKVISDDSAIRALKRMHDRAIA